MRSMKSNIFMLIAAVSFLIFVFVELRNDTKEQANAKFSAVESLLSGIHHGNEYLKNDDLTPSNLVSAGYIPAVHYQYISKKIDSLDWIVNQVKDGPITVVMNESPNYCEDPRLRLQFTLFGVTDCKFERGDKKLIITMSPRVNNSAKQPTNDYELLSEGFSSTIKSIRRISASQLSLEIVDNTNYCDDLDSYFASDRVSSCVYDNGKMNVILELN